MPNLPSLTPTSARTFLLKEKSYTTIKLPSYFSFQHLLNSVSDELAHRPISELYNEKSPTQFINVNYNLLMSEDGAYEWYPLSLIHPALYVALVNKITEEANWNTLVGQMNKHQYLSEVISYSIPTVAEVETQSEKTFLISDAQANFQQKSEELAQAYQYVLQAEIIDCYGPLFTRAITWALHGRERVDNSDEPQALVAPHEPPLGSAIESCIRDMRYGQTSGIPQGSVVMELIVELVLGYVEAELVGKIEAAQIDDYKIIRCGGYYSIFANQPDHADRMGKYLQACLSEIGLGLYEFETSSSDTVLQQSVKADYDEWVKYDKGDSLIYNIYFFSNFIIMHPYTNVIATVLKDFYIRIEQEGINRSQISSLISEITKIGRDNPKTYPFVAAIISNLVHRDKHYWERNSLINTTKRKFNKLPNTGLMELWVQRMSIPINRKKKYEETLCQKVYNPHTPLWNSEWLDEKMRFIIDTTSIIDEGVIERLSLVIGMGEVEVFGRK